MKAERGASVRHPHTNTKGLHGVEGHADDTTLTYSPQGHIKSSLVRPCERRVSRGGGSLSTMSRSCHCHWRAAVEQPISQGTHHKQTCFSWLQVFVTLLTVLPSMAKGKNERGRQTERQTDRDVEIDRQTKTDSVWNNEV